VGLVFKVAPPLREVGWRGWLALRTCGWFGGELGRGRGWCGGSICRRHRRGSGTEHASATTGTSVLIFTTPQEDPTREGIAEL